MFIRVLETSVFLFNTSFFSFMDNRFEVWDAYFSRLKEILTGNKADIIRSLEQKTREEVARMHYQVDEENIKTLIAVAAGFLDERLESYSQDHLDRLLDLSSRDIAVSELELINLQLEWYNTQDEIEAINRKIQTAQNLMQPVEDIVTDLLMGFGAFPNQTIIRTYRLKPELNHVPDYVLALTTQKFINGKEE
jgi:hypothetical protein